jgi:hypothetical protein
MATIRDGDRERQERGVVRETRRALAERERFRRELAELERSLERMRATIPAPPPDPPARPDRAIDWHDHGEAL